MKYFSTGFKCVSAAALCVSLYACGAKDNTEPPKPLTKYTFTVQPHILWQKNVTSGSGDGTTLGLAQDHYRLIAVGQKGDVTALDKRTGKQVWQTQLNSEIASRVNDSGSQVFVPMRNGKLVALDSLNGKINWSTQLSSVSLAPPADASGVVVVHEYNGHVVGLDDQTGKQLWDYAGSTPQMLLQGSSSPVMALGMSYVGMSNGQLFAFTSKNGQVKWNRPIAIADGSTMIDRMIDIDSTPVLGTYGLYAVAYHGNIVDVSPTNGQLIWQHPMSSYNNIALGSEGVFVTNEKSHVFGLDLKTGRSLWSQDALEARWLTGPAYVSGSVVVGDYAGYAHFINAQNGNLQGRIRVGSSQVEGQPLVSGSTIYFITKDGKVSAVES